MNPTMAAIRDKDDAHPLGVVGWRSEDHAMRAALDAVLALHQPCRVGGRQMCEYCTATGDPFCVPDGADEWPCPTVAAITAHLDIEPR